jgi:hypothetical protein
MSHRFQFKPLIGVALATALSACASGPAPLADLSPASPKAEAAASAPLPRALAEEPPLPGEDVSGWPALEAGASRAH